MWWNNYWRISTRISYVCPCAPVKLNKTMTTKRSVCTLQSCGQILSRDDIVDIVHGSAILGSGGGGQISEAMHYVNLTMKVKNPPVLAPISSIPSTAYTASPYLLGAVDGTDSDCNVENENKGDGTTMMDVAVRAMIDNMEGEVGGIVPIEIGATNVAIALYVAALSGVPVVDGDPTGRSVPECTHSTFALHGIPLGAVTVATPIGESFFIQNVRDDSRAEIILRALSSVSGNDLAVIDHVLPFSIIGPALIQNTVSNAWKLGKVHRQYCLPRSSHQNCHSSAHGDVAEALASAGNGLVIFRGVVSHTSFATRHGFTTGKITISNNDANGDRKKNMEIFVKNENMYATIDGATVVTVPEIITLLSDPHGSIVLNPYVKEGLDVCVLVLPAPSPFLTKKGLKIFGPEYLKLDSTFCSVLNSFPSSSSPSNL